MGPPLSQNSIRHAAKVILEEAVRMHQMVLELIDLSRMEAGTLTYEWGTTDLFAVLERVIEEFTPRALQVGVNIHLDLAAQEDSWEIILGDADRLGQVFSNLIDNAIKFSPQGGDIYVTGEANDEWVEVVVADEGQGIPPGESERIFERSYQTDKARSNKNGTGLGLAIAREIVLAHGGTIRAHNRSDAELLAAGTSLSKSKSGGSVFSVRLPRRRIAEEDHTNR